MPNVTYLECSLCSRHFPADRVHNLCPCGGTLFVRYDLTRIKGTWTRDQVRSSRPDLWRYLPVLPPQRPESIVSLGEGMTPLIRTPRLGAAMGAQQLWVKDEGLNPTACPSRNPLSASDAARITACSSVDCCPSPAC